MIGATVDTYTFFSNPLTAICKEDIVKAKQRLSYEITKFVRGEEDANKAVEATKSLFGGGTNLADVPTYEIEKAQVGEISIIDLVAGSKLSQSKSEARKMIEGGGVYLNEEKVTDIRRRATRTSCTL